MGLGWLPKPGAASRGETLRNGHKPRLFDFFWRTLAPSPDLLQFPN